MELLLAPSQELILTIIFRRIKLHNRNQYTDGKSLMEYNKPVLCLISGISTISDGLIK